MPLDTREIEEIKLLLGREPSIEELAMFEAQWSEHCSYKSSRLLLRLLNTESENVLVGPGRDASAVEVFPGLAVVFKIESHNHPSAVEPYNGAATGIGGVIRDVLTLGVKPVALLDLLYMGDPRDPHANWLIQGIVKGISDYGNRVGIPTLSGDTWFDESFNKQPLVNVGCIGIGKSEDVMRAISKRLNDGDQIVIFGNPTGRDGILGSSFASKALSDDAFKEIGAVQIADPLTEKLLINATLELARRDIVNFIKDLGGGGLATALSETLAEFNKGADIELSSLHLRADLTPLEIIVSESQERMLVVVSPDKLDEFREIMERYDLQYSVIGKINNTGRLRIFYKDKVVADVPVRELARPKSIRRDSSPPVEALRGLRPVYNIPDVTISESVLKVFSSLNIVSRRWIYEQYDHEVGVRTIIKPGYADAAVLRVSLDDPSDRRGIAVKGDANPRYTSIDPFNGAANVFCECYRNLTAVGAEPLAFVDELNAGNPEKPWHFWYFENMLKGLAWITHELDIPVIGGKVSFYNEDSRGVQVKPTLTVVGVGRLRDIYKAKTFDFKSHNSIIAVVGLTFPEIGGSEFLKEVLGIEEGELPRPRPVAEIKNALFIRELVDKDLVLSVHDVGAGGLISAILEMSASSGLGVRVDVSNIPNRACSIVELLFSETQSRYVIEASVEHVEEIKALASKHGVRIGFIGSTKDVGEIIIVNKDRELARLDLNHVRDIYLHRLTREIEGS